MKKLLALILVCIINSCSNDKVEERLLFHEENNKTELDKWIETEFTKPYNINVSFKEKYYQEPYLFDNQSPQLDKIKPVMEMIKKVWIMSFVKIVGENKFNLYTPKEIRLFGRANINNINRGEIGTSLGESIIPIYNIDKFDPANSESIYETMRMVTFVFAKKLLYHKPMNLDKWSSINNVSYFNWSMDTNTVGEGPYKFRSNAYCLKRGFITNGAMSNAIDDFAETFSVIVCSSNNELNEILEIAKNTGGEIYKKILIDKIRLVDEYLLTNYNIRREIQLSRAVSNAIREYALTNQNNNKNTQDK